MRKTSILALALVFVSGCGTNIGDPLAGRTTIVQARRACEAWFSRSTGTFESALNGFRALRDAGGREIDIVLVLSDACDESTTNIPLPERVTAHGECLTCLIQITSAVFDE